MSVLFTNIVCFQTRYNANVTKTTGALVAIQNEERRTHNAESNKTSPHPQRNSEPVFREASCVRQAPTRQHGRKKSDSTAHGQTGSQLPCANTHLANVGRSVESQLRKVLRQIGRVQPVCRPQCAGAGHKALSCDGLPAPRTRTCTGKSNSWPSSVRASPRSRTFQSAHNGIARE